jgi:hypothetical protein
LQEEAGMSQLAPPRPPILVTIEDDGLRRLHFRLWQIVMTGLTVFLTVWFMRFGAIPAIIALMVAKHVLVAILVRGFDEPGARHGKPRHTEREDL